MVESVRTAGDYKAIAASPHFKNVARELTQKSLGPKRYKYSFARHAEQVAKDILRARERGKRYRTPFYHEVSHAEEDMIRLMQDKGLLDEIIAEVQRRDAHSHRDTLVNQAGGDTIASMRSHGEGGRGSTRRGEHGRAAERSEVAPEAIISLDNRDIDAAAASGEPSITAVEPAHPSATGAAPHIEKKQAHPVHEGSSHHTERSSQAISAFEQWSDAVLKHGADHPTATRLKEIWKAAEKADRRRLGAGINISMGNNTMSGNSVGGGAMMPGMPTLPAQPSMHWAPVQAPYMAMPGFPLPPGMTQQQVWEWYQKQQNTGPAATPAPHHDEKREKQVDPRIAELEAKVKELEKVKPPTVQQEQHHDAGDAHLAEKGVKKTIESSKYGATVDQMLKNRRDRIARDVGKHWYSPKRLMRGAGYLLALSAITAASGGTVAALFPTLIPTLAASPGLVAATGWIGSVLGLSAPTIAAMTAGAAKGAVFAGAGGFGKTFFDMYRASIERRKYYRDSEGKKLAKLDGKLSYLGRRGVRNTVLGFIFGGVGGAASGGLLEGTDTGRAIRGKFGEITESLSERARLLRARIAEIRLAAPSDAVTSALPPAMSPLDMIPEINERVRIATVDLEARLRSEYDAKLAALVAQADQAEELRHAAFADRIQRSLEVGELNERIRALEARLQTPRIVARVDVPVVIDGTDVAPPVEIPRPRVDTASIRGMLSTVPSHVRTASGAFEQVLRALGGTDFSSERLESVLNFGDGNPSRLTAIFRNCLAAHPDVASEFLGRPVTGRGLNAFEAVARRLPLDHIINFDVFRSPSGQQVLSEIQQAIRNIPLSEERTIAETLVSRLKYTLTQTNLSIRPRI